MISTIWILKWQSLSGRWSNSRAEGLEIVAMILREISQVESLIFSKNSKWFYGELEDW